MQILCKHNSIFMYYHPQSRINTPMALSRKHSLKNADQTWNIVPQETASEVCDDTHSQNLTKSRINPEKTLEFLESVCYLQKDQIERQRNIIFADKSKIKELEAQIASFEKQSSDKSSQNLKQQDGVQELSKEILRLNNVIFEKNLMLMKQKQYEEESQNKSSSILSKEIMRLNFVVQRKNSTINNLKQGQNILSKEIERLNHVIRKKNESQTQHVSCQKQLNILSEECCRLNEALSSKKIEISKLRKCLQKQANVQKETLELLSGEIERLNIRLSLKNEEIIVLKKGADIISSEVERLNIVILNKNNSNNVNAFHQKKLQTLVKEFNRVKTLIQRKNQENNNRKQKCALKVNKDDSFTVLDEEKVEEEQQSNSEQNLMKEIQSQLSLFTDLVSQIEKMHEQMHAK